MKHQVWCAVLCAFALLSGSAPVKTGDKAEPDVSPYLQNLPDCSQPFPRIAKKTNARALLCPMIRDEQGFLSEWVAYYQMHGFDHIMVFDDQSVDSLEELSPWVQSGFVSLHSNWTLESLRVSPAFQKNAFKRAMTVKALLEADCKQAALRWGYDFYVSLDIDEYLIPLTKGATIVDTLLQWANGTQRSVYCIPKYNYASTPHILEPVNLLTIEAYQSRMKQLAKMNYYTSVSPKCAYQLNGPQFAENTSQYIAECCHFHGCQGWDFRAGGSICTENHKQEQYRLSGKGRRWMDLFIINHYARSLEKFGMKSRWKTSTGEVKSGESMEDVAKSYDIPKFLSRNCITAF
ncbi:hypothetical protein B484DRAFT_428599 [Ochromonadaceae sp. CCMP2298]|nr:hypothetical protein B484DRAFT_428599 [Ochromonadaceae sp. CCMP2298]